MNKMKEVARILGVKLGDRFRVQATECIPLVGVLNEEGLMLLFDGQWYQNNIWLIWLLTDRAEIIKEEPKC